MPPGPLTCSQAWLESAGGQTIGTVRQVVADGQGRVQALLVDVKGRTATLPAANFSGQGDVLVSAMSAGEIRKAAKDEAAQDGAAKSDESKG